MHTDEISDEGMVLLVSAGVFDKFVLVKKLTYEFKGQTMEIYKDMMSSFYTKWNMLKLTEYQKTVFVDGDMIITKNIDSIFDIKAPAAYFGQRGTTEYENLLFGLKGFIKNYSISKYPTKTGELVQNEMIEVGLNQSHVMNAGFVLLEPSLDKYNQIIDVLENTGGGFGYDSKSGADEQVLAFVYLKDSTQWTAFGSEYNFNIPKPGRLLVDTKYKTPWVMHYTKKTKPWETEMKSKTKQFMSDRIWMYYFWLAINDSKLTFRLFKNYVNVNRLDYIQRSKSVSRFKYDLSWFDQKYFPWAFNDDAMPKELKGEVKRYAYVWYVDDITQLPLDAMISAISVISSGAGSDRIVYVNKLESDKVDFIRKSHIFTEVIETNDTKFEIFKLTQYTGIIYLDSSVIVSELISFLFNTRAPAGVFSKLSYKKMQSITNSTVRKLGSGVEGHLLLIKPNQKIYESLVKSKGDDTLVTSEGEDTLVTSEGEDTFEKVITRTLSEGPKLRRNWTYITSNYIKESNEPLKISKTKSIYSASGKWDYKSEWVTQKGNLWTENTKKMIRYIDDFDIKSTELEMFGIKLDDINELSD